MAARAVSRRGGGRARPAVSVPPGRAAGPRPRASRLAPQALELLALPGGAGARAPISKFKECNQKWTQMSNCSKALQVEEKEVTMTNLPMQSETETVMTEEKKEVEKEHLTKQKYLKNQNLLTSFR